MLHIAVAGHICIDISTTIGDFSGIRPGALVEVGEAKIALGGCVANTGSALVALGVPVSLAGAIGDDDLGRLVREQLTRNGLPTAGLQISPLAATSYSVVLHGDGLDRTFLHHSGANAFFDASQVDLRDASIVHFGYPSLMRGMLDHGGAPLKKFFVAAHHAGTTTSLDLAVIDPHSEVASLDWLGILANVLPEVDLFSPSFDDLTSALEIDAPFSRDLVERLAAECIEMGAGVVAISAGSHGMYLLAADAERLSKGGTTLARLAKSWQGVRRWQSPEHVTSVATTNGAGDALSAGLLFALWSGMTAIEACATAAISAATWMSGRPLASH